MASRSLVPSRKGPAVQVIQVTGDKYVPPTSLFKPPPNVIPGITPAGAWWTAGEPIEPIAPPTTAPRGLQYLSEQNKIFTPRATEFLTYDDLRRLASYPPASIMITLHANAIAARQFRIRRRQIKGMNNKQREQAEKTDQKIPQLTDFFMNPSPDTTWREFVYMLMSEVQTTDAPAIFIRRTLRGDVAELRVIDGAMIARYIDDNGWTPANDGPAYAQNWWGTPAWNMRRDQLVYRPMSPRVYKLYGNSPTERSARLIELGFARLDLKLQWAANGTIPDGLMIVPPEAPPDLVERQQAWMNAQMVGNSQRRVQLRLIQGFSKDGKDQLLFPKEKMLMDPYDEYEIRMLAVNYDVPKQRFMAQMNRASAEAAQESAEEEGYGPSWQYLRDSMNMILQNPLYLNLPDYEFTYADEREKDVVKQAQADDYYLRNGTKSWTEVRDDIGLDARNNPMDDMPLAFGNPIVPAYESATLLAQAKAAAAPQPKPGEPDEGSGAPKPSPNDPLDNPKPGDPKKLAGRRVLSKSELEDFNRNNVFLAIENSRQNHQFVKLTPGMSIDPCHFSLHGETARRHIEEKLQATFDTVRTKFCEKLKSVAKVVRGKLRKSDDESEIKKLLQDNEYWATLWIDLPAEIQEDLEQAIRAGMAKGLLEADVSVSDAKSINAFNAIAKAAAEARAAELIGMKWVDGELVPNPRAQYVISDTTRSAIKTIIEEAFTDNTPLDDIVKDIQDAGAFGVVRAQMIARTEVSRAQAGGTYTVWEQTGVVKTVRWQHSNMPGVCEECIQNAAAGEIEFGKAFPSGVKYPPDHPNCRCVVYAAKTGNPAKEN